MYETKKKYLKKVYRLRALIKSKTAEVEDLTDLALSISSLDYSRDKVDSSLQQGARFEDAIVKIDELRVEIKKDIEQLLLLKKQISDRIDKVKDNEAKLLLRLRYINYYKWETITEEMGISRSQVYRMHMKALKVF